MRCSQIIMFGFGTKFAWFYLPSIIYHIYFYLGMPIRLRLRDLLTEGVMECLTAIDARVATLSTYVLLLLPLTGFASNKLLHFVPFRSPALTILCFLFDVRSAFVPHQRLSN
jgi:hypothetical protein